MKNECGLDWHTSNMSVPEPSVMRALAKRVANADDDALAQVPGPVLAVMYRALLNGGTYLPCPDREAALRAHPSARPSLRLVR